MANPFPEGATLLAAGPDAGAMHGWAELLSPALARSFPSGTAIRTESAGAADGVTAANQFEARAVPDGATALVAPGAAALDWMTGDPRARFDAAHWVPAMAALGSGVLAARFGLEQLGPGRRVRIAAATPSGPDLPGLLALDLLGVEVVPVFGLMSDDAAHDALTDGAVDAVFLHGRNLPGRLAPVLAAGARPLFCLGLVDEAGAAVRDPRFPGLPAFPELQAGLRPGAEAGRLFAAWRAAAAAAQLDMALVLPQLTPAAMVALWRRACARALPMPELQSAAADLGLRLQASPAATASVAALAASAPDLLELRRWLAARFNWHPG